jgi:hypothetical protein
MHKIDPKFSLCPNPLPIAIDLFELLQKIQGDRQCWEQFKLYFERSAFGDFGWDAEI